MEEHEKGSTDDPHARIVSATQQQFLDLQRTTVPETKWCEFQGTLVTPCPAQVVPDI